MDQGIRPRVISRTAALLCVALLPFGMAAWANDGDLSPDGVKPSESRPLDIQRDVRNRIKRSYAAKTAFRRLHPCPATQKSTGPCHGYVIDHIVALKRGGADAPDNMQWQTVEEARAKDRVE